MDRRLDHGFSTRVAERAWVRVVHWDHVIASYGVVMLPRESSGRRSESCISSAQGRRHWLIGGTQGGFS